MATAIRTRSTPGHPLAVLRAARQISQEALAAAAGIDVATVQRTERRKTSPSEHTLTRLAGVLGVQPLCLIPLDGHRRPGLGGAVSETEQPRAHGQT